MGSRLSFSSKELASNLAVSTKFFSQTFPSHTDILWTSELTTPSAEVTFNVGPGHPRVFVFDVSHSESGDELSCDFNFFRYPERYTVLLRCLFEAQISFQVIH